MSIVAECPHCETRFTLHSDLVGKSMRCPNLDCREVFQVRPAIPPAPPPSDSPPPPADTAPAKDLVLSLDDSAAQPPTSGAVEEFIPVVDAVLASPPPPRPPKPATPRPAPRRGKPAPEPEPEVVDAVVVAPAAREVVWTPDADAPAPTRDGRGRVRPETDEHEPVLRRRKRRNRGPLILMVLGITTIVAAGAGILYIFQFQQKTEDRLAEQAKEQYAKPDYAAAARSYESLADEYPESPRIEEYRFFAELAAMQVVVRSVTNRENPRPALEKFRGFIATRKDSPLARPEKGYGRDIVEAGRKLGEDVVGHAEDRVQAFISDRSKRDELSKAEEMVAAGRELVPLVEPFRSKDDRPLDKIVEGLNQVEGSIRKERYRLDVIARVRDIVKEPTAAAIEDAKQYLAASGYGDDPEGRELVRSAEVNFLANVRFEPDPAAAQPPMKPATASILFVAPVGATQQSTRGQLDEPPVVFLAVARGILYALDEDTGNLLWAARLGPDVYDPPTVARVQLPEGPADLALVPSNVSGQSILSGIEIRTGAVRWQQNLDAPVVGPAAVVGPRAYVPLHGPTGTVAVIDLTTGTRVGRILLGQPVAYATARTDSGQLLIAADSRRLFVFDVASSNLEGARPRCIRVVTTDHPAGTLRSPPVILGSPGEEPASRLLVLCQADGPTAMRIRAFRLPPAPALSPDSPPVNEAIAPDVELPVPGWARFAPIFDGERLVIVTDAGQFRLFGVNQPGNQDRTLYPVPFPTLPSPPDSKPIPGLVVPAEEGAFWVLAGGSLQKFRRTILFDRGVALVPAGPSESIGEPTQAVQLNARRDTALFVVRSPNSAGCRAIALGLYGGERRWERQLGVVPASAPIHHGGGLLLPDADGGAVSLPAAELAGLQGPTKSPPDWVSAPPAPGAAGPTRVATAVDGKTTFTLTPVRGEDGSRWLIRRFAEGILEHTGSVAAPAALAGSLAIMNGQLLVPAADGSIYRLNPGDGRVRPDSLSPGPQWADRKLENPSAFVMVVSDDSFITSDGGRGLTRWVWPKDGKWSSSGARWEVRERIATTPVYWPASGGRPARLLVGDVTGAVWLFDPDRGGAPVRQWVPGRTVSIPAGDLSPGFGVQASADGNRVAAYSVDGKRVVCLDIDRSEPRWVVSVGDDAGRAVVGTPVPMGGNWLVTDLAGRVNILHGETGETVATLELALPGLVPTHAGVPLGQSVVVPLSDGSVAVLRIPSPAPQPESKP